MTGSSDLSHNRAAKVGPTAIAMYDATRKRRKGKRRRRSGEQEITGLNITPMLDMMTILLVFLLMNFASSSEDVSAANLVLPHSTTKLSTDEALQLMITQDEILVDKKVVTKLENGFVAEADLPEGPQGYLIKPLYDALETNADRLKSIEGWGGSQFVGRVAIIADKGTNYRLLFRVLYTAGRAEFGRFKLFLQKHPS